MFTNKRNQVTGICVSILLLICAPAFATESEPELANVPQEVVNLDLCTLAYQLYHQSLCLPLDPWYDMMSRVGSDRRNNICRFTHDYAATLGVAEAENAAGREQSFYSGPNAARNWKDTNLSLDPILTNYKRIDSKLPALTRDGEHFISILAPDYITTNIKVIEGARYRSKPASFPFDDVELFPIREYPDGEDHLIAFEGGTGIVEASSPAWSLMGFVLMQKTPKGYDAHIVFRGSRSGGSLSKTVWKAQGAIGDPRGNPDWITDLRGVKQIKQPIISTVGTVTEGFAESLPTMLGPITACCKYLETKYPAPDHIYVTGHSLGAGLAAQFVSATLQGTYAAELRKQVKSWPWDATTLVAYAQPIPGDNAWAANFDKLSAASQHYWVAGDEVVEATSNSVVGLFIDKGADAGVQNKLSAIADCKDNPHEVFVIRDAILRSLAAKDAPLVKGLGRENTWAYYATFADMLLGRSESYVEPGAPAPKIVTEENLRKILQNCDFDSEFSRWLEQVYAKMIDEKSSYIGFKLQSTLDARRKLVLSLAEWMKEPPSNESTQELDGLEKEFKLIDGQLGLTNEEEWIYCGMILSRIQNSKLTFNELLTKPVIKTCLESHFN